MVRKIKFSTSSALSVFCLLSLSRGATASFQFYLRSILAFLANSVVMLVCLGELKILFNDNFHWGPYVAFMTGELSYSNTFSYSLLLKI